MVIDGNTGNKMILYLGDAFDHQWVRTPGSIDIMADSWSQLHEVYASLCSILYMLYFKYGI